MIDPRKQPVKRNSRVYIKTLLYPLNRVDSGKNLTNWDRDLITAPIR
jgi:hypothetical protein